MGNLKDLMDIEGFDDELEFGEEMMSDSVVMGICTNKGCTYTVEVEPDCRNGYCEDCKTQTVKSGLVLMGVI